MCTYLHLPLYQKRQLAQGTRHKKMYFLSCIFNMKEQVYRYRYGMARTCHFYHNFLNLNMISILGGIYFFFAVLLCKQQEHNEKTQKREQ